MVLKVYRSSEFIHCKDNWHSWSKDPHCKFTPTHNTQHRLNLVAQDLGCNALPAALDGWSTCSHNTHYCATHVRMCVCVCVCMCVLWYRNTHVHLGKDKNCTYIHNTLVSILLRIVGDCMLHCILMTTRNALCMAVCMQTQVPQTSACIQHHAVIRSHHPR